MAHDAFNNGLNERTELMGVQNIGHAAEVGRACSIGKCDDPDRQPELETLTAAIYLHSHRISHGVIAAGDSGMEHQMRLSRRPLAELALTCGFMLTALAMTVSVSAAETGSKMAARRHLAVHHESVDPRATAQAPAKPTFFSFPFGSYVPTPRKPETDGLSRNPNDCVRYGCIDNGG
jgi:hypothetical protein